MKVIGIDLNYGFQIGIIVGIIGIAGMATNYAFYKKILNNGKEKYAADIIRLANEINEN